MQRVAWRLVVLGTVLSLNSYLWGQTILDRVEDALRRRTQRAGSAATSETGYLGVIADDSSTKGQGLEIIDIIPGSPADNAGLKKRDLITGVDGRGVRRMDDMAREMNGRAAGSGVEFEVVRDGRTLRIDVVLGQRTIDSERTSPGGTAARDISGTPPSRGATGPRLGIRTAPVSEVDRQVFSLADTRGAKIVALTVGSAADRGNLVVGDIITALNGQAVESPDDITRAMQQLRPGSDVDITLIREGQELVKRISLAAAAGTPRPANAPRPADAGPGDWVPKPAPDRIEELERRVRELESRLERLESSVRPGR